MVYERDVIRDLEDYIQRLRGGEIKATYYDNKIAPGSNGERFYTVLIRLRDRDDKVPAVHSDLTGLQKREAIK